MLPKLEPSFGSNTAWRPKKKSKIMIRTAKKTKQRTSFPPISIGWVVKIAASAVGFYLWGWDFAWVVLGVVFCGRLLKGIASCLVSLICLIGFFWFIFTHIL